MTVHTFPGGVQVTVPDSRPSSISLEEACAMLKKPRLRFDQDLDAAAHVILRLSGDPFYRTAAEARLSRESNDDR